MPAEPNLHDLFRSTPTPGSGDIDVQAVISRSRRRRLPRQLGAGSVFTLAIAGVGVAGVSGLNSMRWSATDEAATLMESDGSAEDAAGGAPAVPEEGDISRAPAEKLNLCGGTLAEVAPSESGLELTVEFPDADAGAASVEGTATLTNNGSERQTGYTAASPAITLSQDGIVLWHSNGPMIMLAAEVDLAPGESTSYVASFVPVVCGVEDDMGESFREDLPAATAGEYQVSAAIDFNGSGVADLITGPASTVTLR